MNHYRLGMRWPFVVSWAACYSTYVVDSGCSLPLASFAARVILQITFFYHRMQAARTDECTLHRQPAFSGLSTKVCIFAWWIVEPFEANKLLLLLLLLWSLNEWETIQGDGERQNSVLIRIPYAPALNTTPHHCELSSGVTRCIQGLGALIEPVSMPSAQKVSLNSICLSVLFIHLLTPPCWRFYSHSVSERMIFRGGHWSTSHVLATVCCVRVCNIYFNGPPW